MLEKFLSLPPGFLGIYILLFTQSAPCPIQSISNIYMLYLPLLVFTDFARWNIELIEYSNNQDIFKIKDYGRLL